MDCNIERFAAEPLGADLMLCAGNGVAYQRDMAAGRVEYGADYLAKVEAYDPAIAARVNGGRCAFVGRHVPAGAPLLDYGAGSGGFVMAARDRGFEARGFDVMAPAAERLREAGLYSSDVRQARHVTLWDTLEHLEDPGATLLARLGAGVLLFVSLPIFEDLRHVRSSRHYRPGEHLYYFTREGLIAYMALYGFLIVDESLHEIIAGRESIGAFAFYRAPRVCQCGGDADLISSPCVDRPTEYFIRCATCGSCGPCMVTPADAHSAWELAA